MTKQRFSTLTATVALSLVGLTYWPSAASPGSVDPADTVLIPPILFELKHLEDEDPDTTIFKVDQASFVLPTFSGNLQEVAKYQTLSSGAYLHNLFFLKSFSSGILTLEADTAGTDSRRLVATYKDPNRIEAEVSDTRVLHRLDHTNNGINLDFNPGQNYLMAWERIRGDVNVGLSKTDPDVKVGLVGSFETQTRSGDQQHTFFQLHRYNCTDCHTFSGSQGISQTTNTYTAGIQGSLPNRTFLYAGFGGSTFSDSNSLLTFDFGGPFSNAVTSQTNSKDTTSQFMAYTGDEQWRVGGTLFQLNRANTDTGQTWNQGWYSANALYQPMDELQVTVGASGENQVDTIPSNLSSNRKSLYIEAVGYPTNWLTARLRLGEDDRTYQLGAGPILTNGYNVLTHDKYWDVRLDAHPDKTLRLGMHYRGDDNSQPFFSIDPARKDLLEAWLTWSPDPVVVGVNYHRLGTSNDIYGGNEETWSAYFNAVVNSDISFYGTYSATSIGQNSNGPVFMQDVLGLPELMQIGFPYSASMNVFTVGGNFGIGEGRIRPYYRLMNSSSQGNFLPGATFDNFIDDTRLSLRETAFGLHVDLPAWKGTSLGLGWELQNWVDLMRSANSGKVNFFTLDFRTRF